MPGTTFSYLMRLPDGSCTWWNWIWAPLLVAGKSSTGMDTSASLICPRQIARAAMNTSPCPAEADSIHCGYESFPRCPFQQSYQRRNIFAKRHLVNDGGAADDAFRARREGSADVLGL